MAPSNMEDKVNMDKGVFDRTVTWVAQNAHQIGATMLMPLKPKSKCPMFAHKNGEWTHDMLTKFIKANPKHSSWGLLLDKMCVVDADNQDAVDWLEVKIQDPDVRSVMDQCPVQITKKGKHYLFLRPSWADEEGYWDGARQKGTDVEVDLKTKCSTGTRGLLVVAPTTGKHWACGRAPWDESVKLVEMPRALAELVATPKQIKKTVERKNHVAADTVDVATTSTPTMHIDVDIVDLDEVKALVKILSPKRADSYPTWIEVGWCLRNISATLLPEWVQFSRQSAKFKSGECDALWQTMRGSGKNIGSLCRWANEDSPYEYRQILNKRVFADIKDCNGSHNDVARIASKLLRGSYVCATANGKLWYAFDGTLWREDQEAIRVRHELSSTVRMQFMSTFSKISAQLVSMDDILSNTGSSSHTAVKDSKALSERLLHIASKLQDAGYKDSVLKEMREYLFDPKFLRSLDSNPNLVAFENGVWELKEKRFRSAMPDDKLCLSVGYAFCTQTDERLRAKVLNYWATLHPDEGQRSYIIRSVARQLFGDSGQELFHVHAGHLASASNGKTKFFEIMELACGSYVRKFGVEMLTAKQRIEPGKPMPEFEKWRGVRILYCSEPNQEDQLNSGIMKDLTGGEVITYRLLHSNDIQQFRPQFKMHVMTNDAPAIDGSDSGVKRRVRKIDYISRFVDKSEVDVKEHKYARDPEVIQSFKDNVAMRMEFIRVLFEAYDQGWEFPMSDAIKESSKDYLEDNDAVLKFAKQWIVKDPEGYFTLKEAKQKFMLCEYFNQRSKTLKNDLQKALGTVCHTQKWLDGANHPSVFMGFRILDDEASASPSPKDG